MGGFNLRVKRQGEPCQSRQQQSIQWASVVFATVALVVLCLRGYIMGPWLLLDVDLGWHLAYGEWIIEAGGLPAVDEWSWSKAGEAYQLTQWGGEVLLGVAYVAGGHAGLMALNAVTLAATLLLMYRVSSAQVGGVLACVITGVSGFLYLVGVVRPTMFSWMLAAWLVFQVSETAKKGTIGHALVLPVIVGLWTNIHGSFVLGVAGAMAALGALAATCAVRGDDKRAWQFALLALACWLATMVNPYGWYVWEAVWNVASLETTSTRYFSDWKRTEFFSGLAVPAWLGLAGAACALYRGKGMWVACVCLGAAGLSLSAQRNAGLAAVVTNAGLAYALAGGWLDEKIKAETSSRGVAPLRTWIMCSMSAGLALWSLTHVTGERVAEAEKALYPVVCAEGLKRYERFGNGPEGDSVRLLNEFEHGGWWIRNAKTAQVFIDGRADLHGDKAYSTLEKLKHAEPGWRQELDRLQPDAICLNSTARIFDELSNGGEYEPVASDDKWALWRRVQLKT